MHVPSVIDLDTIAAAMDAKGKTQGEAAIVLFNDADKQPTVSKIFKGKRRLQRDEYEKLVVWLGLREKEELLHLNLPSEQVAAEVVRLIVRAAVPGQDVDAPVAEGLAEGLLGLLRRLAANPHASTDPAEARQEWLDAMQQAFLQRLGRQVA
jgi:hypothetical protein